jgi:GxxExxY protein
VGRRLLNTGVLVKGSRRFALMLRRFTQKLICGTLRFNPRYSARALSGGMNDKKICKDLTIFGSYILNGNHIQELMHENEISYIIRGAAFKVHTNLGPGLLESVYERILALEIRRQGLIVNTQIGVPILYEDEFFENGYRMDLPIENKVIVEVKSVDALMDVHHKQLLTYLKLADKRLCLLINFNSVSLKGSMKRIVNNL